MSTAKKVISITAVSLVFLLLVWVTMFYNDYNRVVRQYQRPCFVLTELETLNRQYGEYRGLGYTIKLSAKFKPQNVWQTRDERGNIVNPYPGIIYAEFYFGDKLIGQVNRTPEEYRVEYIKY